MSVFGGGGLGLSGRALIVLIAILCGSCRSDAFEWLNPQPTIFVFGGQYRTMGFPGIVMVPFTKGRESNYIAGAAYDVQIVDLGWGFTAGGEVGLAGRFGDNSSAELWAGGSLRHRGLDLGFVTVMFGMVAGISGVTDTIGKEAWRESLHSGDARLLFYLGPELSFRFNVLPKVDFVIRTHHRSGALGTLGNMNEGSNANVLGMRFSF